MFHHCVVILPAVLCCRCGRNEATHTSPSGNQASVYCDQCCVSRCGKHSIEDFEYDESIERWVDPCVARRTKAEQRELWEVKK